MAVPPIKAVWKRIHAWLDGNAPEGYGHLRSGASDAAIRMAETAMGLTLPADVKASYRVHDGQAKEPGLIGGEGWCLLPLQEMVKSYDPRFACRVPVAWNAAGDRVFVDIAPDAVAQGCLIVQRHDSDAPDPVAPSFRSWLTDFADKLEDDEFAYSEEHGEIMYADEIDVD